MDTFQDERQNLAPNDPYFRNQWALGNNAGDINWQEGKAKYRQDSQGGSPNGPKLVVAVIDSGIQILKMNCGKTLEKSLATE